MMKTNTPRTDYLYKRFSGVLDEEEMQIMVGEVSLIELELAKAKTIVTDVTDGRRVYLQHEIDEVAQRALNAEAERNELQKQLAEAKADIITLQTMKYGREREQAETIISLRAEREQMKLNHDFIVKTRDRHIQMFNDEQEACVQLHKELANAKEKLVCASRNADANLERIMELRAEVERLRQIIDDIAAAGGDEGASARMVMEATQLRAELATISKVAAERLEIYTATRRENDQLRARIAELEALKK
jgi:chromosome segregation ATPase